MTIALAEKELPKFISEGGFIAGRVSAVDILEVDILGKDISKADILEADIRGEEACLPGCLQVENRPIIGDADTALLVSFCNDL